MPGHLPNYLKATRKRTGLSQRDVAFLIGGNDGSKISHYEQGIMPPLDIALALQTIYGTPVAELFAGVHESVGNQVSIRIDELIGDLEQRDTPRRYRLSIQQKLRWLEEHPDVADTLKAQSQAHDK